jgi:hypothetical protein
MMYFAEAYAEPLKGYACLRCMFGVMSCLVACRESSCELSPVSLIYLGAFRALFVSV